MLVLNANNEIFLGERHSSKDIWQFPQGGVKEGISLEENVLRELEEELGADRNLFEIIAKLNATHEYEFQDPPEYAKGKWRGQRQTFWAVRYKGKDTEINLLKDENPEFMAYKWCKISDVLDLAEQRRKEGYSKALKALQDLGISNL